MSHRVDLDVVVAGAGPAGAAAAISCRRAGLRVAMLDRAVFPRFHVGESLHPGVEALLQQLGVAEAVLKPSLIRFDGIWLERGASRSFSSFGSDLRSRWRGYQVDRAAFDETLRDRAEHLGTVVIQPSRVKTVVRDGAEIVIDCEHGELRCRVVIDATGSGRVVARQLGSGFLICSPRILTKYGYRAGEAPRLSDRPLFTMKPAGWQWIARVRPNVYQWIQASWGHGGPGRNEVPRQLVNLKECGPSRGADVTWRRLREPAGRGYFAVGDAAAVLDPSSSHGVLRALSSGMMAAHCIRARLLGGASEFAVTRFYNDWLYRWFTVDSSRLASSMSPFTARASATLPIETGNLHRLRQRSSG